MNDGGGVLTLFQESCRAAVDAALRKMGIRSEFEMIRGEREDYLRTAFSSSGVTFEVYIYLDEAGFFAAGKWFIFEREDFDSSEPLIDALIRALEERLEQL